MEYFVIANSHVSLQDLILSKKTLKFNLYSISLQLVLFYKTLYINRDDGK